MNATVKAYLSLQEIEVSVFDMRKKIKDRPAQLAREEAALKEAEKTLLLAKEHNKDAHRGLDARNLELKTLEEAIKKLDTQAQTLKTNEEYAAMQKQISGKKTEIGAIEDRILESMEALDAAKATLPPLEALVKEKQAHLKLSSEKVKAEVASLQARLLEAEGELARRSANVPKEELASYRWLVDRFGPSAVVTLSPDRICQGCHMSVTTHALNEAMAGKAVVCGSCKRLLNLV